MKRFLTILALAATAGATAWADEARLLRFPATNGTEVAFSYAGDLWTVPIQGGEARRLTSHIGYEMFARYSPDGKSIAFTGEYDGNREVYLIPAKGGEPVRLTYTSTNERDDLGDRMGPNNIVMTWAPDGKSIVYRNRIGDGFPGKLWTVSPEGGMPAEVPRREETGLQPRDAGIPHLEILPGRHGRRRVDLRSRRRNGGERHEQ